MNQATKAVEKLRYIRSTNQNTGKPNQSPKTARPKSYLGLRPSNKPVKTSHASQCPRLISKTSALSNTQTVQTSTTLTVDVVMADSILRRVLKIALRSSYTRVLKAFAQKTKIDRDSRRRFCILVHHAPNSVPKYDGKRRRPFHTFPAGCSPRCVDSLCRWCWCLGSSFWLGLHQETHFPVYKCLVCRCWIQIIGV